MKYRNLGETRISVSEIGFGGWGLGGDAYGPIDEKEVIKALNLSFENGVNFFDTSDLYGSGKSEKLLGKFTKYIRDKVVIATKGGAIDKTETNSFMPQDFSENYLRKALENSLKRLQTDYVDLYQLHSPRLENLVKTDAVQTLQKFKQEGKIREYGISVKSPDDGLIALKKFDFPVIQVNFNMIDQRALENGLFNLAKKNNIGIINRTPLSFGYLTSKLNGNEKFTSKDHRKNWSKKQLKLWAEAPDLFEEYGLFNNSRSPVQTAILFCLSFPSVSTVIPGMMKSEHVKENVILIDEKNLTKDEQNIIIAIYRSNNFYVARSK